MSCPYCTPVLDEDAGESLEFCKGMHHSETIGSHGTTTTRIQLLKDEDGWQTVILLHDEWLSNYIHELGEKSEHAGMIVTTIPGPSFCPWCGRRLED